MSRGHNHPFQILHYPRLPRQFIIGGRRVCRMTREIHTQPVTAFRAVSGQCASAEPREIPCAMMALKPETPLVTQAHLNLTKRPEQRVIDDSLVRAPLPVAAWTPRACGP